MSLLNEEEPAQREQYEPEFAQRVDHLTECSEIEHHREEGTDGGRGYEQKKR